MSGAIIALQLRRDVARYRRLWRRMHMTCDSLRVMVLWRRGLSRGPLEAPRASKARGVCPPLQLANQEGLSPKNQNGTRPRLFAFFLLPAGTYVNMLVKCTASSVFRDSCIAHHSSPPSSPVQAPFPSKDSAATPLENTNITPGSHIPLLFFTKPEPAALLSDASLSDGPRSRIRQRRARGFRRVNLVKYCHARRGTCSQFSVAFLRNPGSICGIWVPLF